jgi:hypothetical protein
VTYKGVVERTALLEEALQSEVFIYLPTASETHHTLVLDMMMADQLILAQRFPSVQQVLDKERGVFLEQDAEGRLVFDMPLLRTLMTERPDLRQNIIARARAWAETQSWPSAVRAWEEVFHQQLETLSKVDAPSWAHPAAHHHDVGAESAHCGSSIQAGLQVLLGWLSGSIWLLVVTWRSRRPGGKPEGEEVAAESPATSSASR